MHRHYALACTYVCMYVSVFFSMQTKCREALPCGTHKTRAQLTVSVLEGLLLFGGFGNNFDPLAEEDTDVGAVAVEHLD